MLSRSRRLIRTIWVTATACQLGACGANSYSSKAAPTRPGVSEKETEEEKEREKQETSSETSASTENKVCLGIVNGTTAEPGQLNYVLKMTAPSACTVTLLPSQDSTTKSAEPSAELVESYAQAINSLRATAQVCGGESMPAVPPLTWNAKLYAAALRHSTDLDANNIGGHQGTDGSFPDPRVTDAGYHYFNVGENQVSGASTLAQAFAAWMASPAHCRGNMSILFSEFGLAQSGTTWTLVFAKPK